MKKKRVLALGALALAVMLWGAPMTAEAVCGSWDELVKQETYCATPVCYTGNRTYFVEHTYSRWCYSLLWNISREYKIEKVDNGCCPYN